MNTAHDPPAENAQDSEAQPIEKSSENNILPISPQLHGWRLILLLTSLFTGLFLSFLDTTIVAVALPVIASQFNDFSHASWVLTAYLLTYMAFAIIISRFSDLFGKKTVEVASFTVFIAFSLGCGLSQSMTQLIILRALQGIGGSGLYSMMMVIGLNAVQPTRRALIGAGIGVVMVVSGILGPVLSGAITGDRTSDTWRWIFYLNIPVGGAALAALLVAWPIDRSEKLFTRNAAKTIDVLGCILLLAASVLLIFALEEAGAYVYLWDSPVIITCLVISGVAAVAFVAWQQCISAHPDWTVKLIFPMSMLGHRVVGASILVTFLAGFNYYIAVVNLPQRFQIVDGDSPVAAGVKLLPLMISSAASSIAAGAINRRRNLHSYTVIVASALQLLGYGLMTTLGDSEPTPQRQFGFQVLLGAGFGPAISIVTQIVQLQAPPQWLAVTQGALTQMRSLGGSIGLSVAVIVSNTQIRNSDALSQALGAEQMESLLKSPLAIAALSSKQQLQVSQVFARAFTQEMRVATYIAAVCFAVSFLTFQRNPPQPGGLSRPPKTPTPADKHANTHEAAV